MTDRKKIRGKAQWKKAANKRKHHWKVGEGQRMAALRRDALRSENYTGGL